MAPNQFFASSGRIATVIVSPTLSVVNSRFFDLLLGYAQIRQTVVAHQDAPWQFRQ
jgi:hypothetical protein